MLGPVIRASWFPSGESRQSLGTKARRPGSRLLPPVARLLGPQHLRVEVLELRRDEALRVHQGLLPDIVARHPLEMGARHLEVVSEDAIVPDLEIPNPCPRPLPSLPLA